MSQTKKGIIAWIITLLIFLSMIFYEIGRTQTKVVCTNTCNHCKNTIKELEDIVERLETGYTLINYELELAEEQRRATVNTISKLTKAHSYSIQAIEANQRLIFKYHLPKKKEIN